LSRLVTLSNFTTPSVSHSRQRLHELSQSDAVHVPHAARIEDKAVMTLLECASNFVRYSKPSSSIHRDVASNGQHGYSADYPSFDVHDASPRFLLPSTTAV
jgi:hypothetical protein